MKLPLAIEEAVSWSKKAEIIVLRDRSLKFNLNVSSEVLESILNTRAKDELFRFLGLPLSRLPIYPSVSPPWRSSLILGLDI